MYLRARYYAPPQGRFLTRDLWDGDPNRPMSYNAWLYVYANPVNFTDPSGLWYCVGHASCRAWITDALDILTTMGATGRQLADEFEAFDESVKRAAMFLTGNRSCGELGFPFVVQGKPPFGFEMATTPWAIYIHGTRLNDPPDEYDAALLGHELVHLLRFGYYQNLSVQGEMLAARMEARLLISRGKDLYPQLQDALKMNEYAVKELEEYKNDYDYYLKPWLAPPGTILVRPDGSRCRQDITSVCIRIGGPSTTPTVPPRPGGNIGAP